MRPLYSSIIAPTLAPLVAMRRRGMLVDTEELERKREEAKKEHARASDEVLAVAAPRVPKIDGPEVEGCSEHPHPNRGEGVRKCERCAERRAAIREWKASPVVRRKLRLSNFNPVKPDHVRWLLGEELGLKWPAIGWTDTGIRSVRLLVLQELLELRSTPDAAVPLLRTLISLAHVGQRLRTFLDPPIGVDGCAHPNSSLCGTSTLRIRSGAIREDVPIEEEDYNGQNIPKDVRSIYVARPGHVLLAADAAQIEWIMTMIAARCGRAVEAYEREEDIHSQNLELLAPIFGWSWNDKAGWKARRSVCKTFTHAEDYGEGDFNLARRMRIEQRLAAAGRAAYFAAWPEIPVWQKGVEEEVLARRELRTVFGFRRRFFDVTAKSSGGRRVLMLDSKQRKEALATGPQSMNAVLHLVGIADLTALGVGLYTVQHDEHVVEVREEEAERLTKEVKHTLEREVPEFEALIGKATWRPRVEVSRGRNWGPKSEGNPGGMERVL